MQTEEDYLDELMVINGHPRPSASDFDESSKSDYFSKLASYLRLREMTRGEIAKAALAR